MGNSLYLIQLLVLAGIVWAVMMRVPMLRHRIGFADIRETQRFKGSIEQHLVHVIAKSGNRPAREEDGVMVFRNLLEMRLIGPTIAGLLVLQIAILGFAGVYDFAGFMLIVVACVFLSVQTWIAEVQISGSEISWVDIFMRDQIEDLANLRSVEQDESGGYRLEFHTGKTVYLHRYVEGHKLLRKVLIDALEINANTTAPQPSGLDFAAAPNHL